MTEQGLTIPTRAEILTRLEDAVRAAIPGIDLSSGPERKIIDEVAERLSEVWNTLDAIHRSRDPDGASGLTLDRLASITGTIRRAATRSRVTASVTVAAGKTLPAGAIASVAGNPNAMFRSVAAHVGTGAPAPVIFEALAPGPVEAPPGSLTRIVSSVSGWSAITNAVAAVLGRLGADDAELRAQRLVELAGAGRGTLASIRAAVARSGVQSVSVYENTSIAPDGAGRPGKCFEVVVWDGATPSVDNAVIAQAIFDKKPGAILAHGTSSGTATDELGVDHVVAFTRAAALRVYVSIEVVLKPDASATWQDDVKAAIAGRAYTVGEKAYASQLMCEAMDNVPSIEAVTSITLGTVAPGTADLVTPTYAQIVRIDEGDVSVTEA